MDKIEKKLSKKKYGKDVCLDGWTVKYSTRQRVGQGPDAYYFPPGSNLKHLSSNIRSLPDIEKYLQANVQEFNDTTETHDVSYSVGKSWIYI